jgi:hypothetical protein
MKRTGCPSFISIVDKTEREHSRPRGGDHWRLKITALLNYAQKICLSILSRD